MKKRILCFGDSNTWGYTYPGIRFDETVRWPMRLQTLLGDDYQIVEEGLNGRTCVFDDPTEGGHKSGLEYLPACVMSHKPLDLIIIMLGTNDQKLRFGMNANAIAGGVTTLVKTARFYAENSEDDQPKIMIVCPPPVASNVLDTRHGPAFGLKACEISRQLPDELRKVAELTGCAYLNAGDYSDTSPTDAIHLTRESHLRLADALCCEVKKII